MCVSEIQLLVVHCQLLVCIRVAVISWAIIKVHQKPALKLLDQLQMVYQLLSRYVILLSLPRQLIIRVWFISLKVCAWQLAVQQLMCLRPSHKSRPPLILLLKLKVTILAECLKLFIADDGKQPRRTVLWLVMSGIGLAAPENCCCGIIITAAACTVIMFLLFQLYVVLFALWNVFSTIIL